MERRKRGVSNEDLGKYRRHYSEDGLWRKVGAMPRRTGRAVIEKALTLYVILTDAETPLWARTIVIAALGYFICPIDAIPDAIPVLGYADDLAVMGLVLSQLSHMVTPAMRDRVDRLLPEGMKSKPAKERRTERHEQVEDERDAAGGKP